MMKEPTQLHQDAKKAVEDAIRPFADLLGPADLLAVLSQMVGMTAAMQDQTKYTPEQVIDLIMENVQIGNQAVLQQLMDTQGGS